jgi:hypothetical protein
MSATHSHPSGVLFLSVVILVECKLVGMKTPPDAGVILQGTLDMLILRTLVMGAAHGYTIAEVIEHTSENALEVRTRIALSRTPSA